jgi:hypothetical protein
MEHTWFEFCFPDNGMADTEVPSRWTMNKSFLGETVTHLCISPEQSTTCVGNLPDSLMAQVSASATQVLLQGSLQTIVLQRRSGFSTVKTNGLGLWEFHW